MNHAEQFQGRVLATLESLDRSVQEIKHHLEKKEQRLRSVEDQLLTHKVWAGAIAAVVSTLLTLLPSGVLKRLIGA